MCELMAQTYVEIPGPVHGWISECRLQFHYGQMDLGIVGTMLLLPSLVALQTNGGSAGGLLLTRKVSLMLGLGWAKWGREGEEWVRKQSEEEDGPMLGNIGSSSAADNPISLPGHDPPFQWIHDPGVPYGLMPYT